MICFPNAKINIGLNIIEKRADGFHNLETVMFPLTGILFDALEVVRSQEFGVRSSGIKIPGDVNQNLCVKAHELIRKDYPQIPPINIHLLKAIPIGAGLGGGSADAAFFIRLLNDAFELGISWGEMHNYARQLGSDCSFFVSNRPAFAEGKGDHLESVQLYLSGYYIVLVCPEIHINTAQAYKDFDAIKTPSSKSKAQSPKGTVRFKYLIQLPVEKWKGKIKNDFERLVFPKHPEIKKIKEKLYALGAVYASMSGSGSAVYGIFKKLPGVKAQFPKSKVYEGKLT